MVVRSKALISPALVLSLITSPVQARFLSDDAQEIDRDERLNTESYNDIVSYRFPVHWDRDWEHSDVGFRVSAGSLSMTRFAYIEEVKLRTPSDNPAILAFTQNRHENTLEQRLEREFRASYTPVGHAQISIMGDGGTFKEFGDVGLAASFFADSRHFVESFYWSVDHYYNQKKSEPDDSMDRRPRTVGLRGKWEDSRGNSFDFNAEHDAPMDWERVSRGYSYQNMRSKLKFGIHLDIAKKYQANLLSDLERKYEAKQWQLGSEKSMQRFTGVHEVSLDFLRDTIEWESGLMYIHRDVEAYFSASPQLASADYPEPESPDSRRREYAYFLTANFPIERATQHRLQFGGFWNHAFVDEGILFNENEVKFQAGWEYSYTKSAHLFLNSTWDLDTLAADFPYNRIPFRPWGGGNIQLIAMF